MNFSQNFALGIVQSQLNTSLTDDSGGPTPLSGLFDLSDYIFIALFTLELLVNMACNLWSRFVGDWWCRFDLVIVSMSLLSLGPLPIPSGIIRLLRAFRVIRFGPFESRTAESFHRRQSHRHFNKGRLPALGKDTVMVAPMHTRTHAHTF